MNKTQFNAAQQQAILSLNSDTFISAGAGTGKTTVLVNRFLEMLKLKTPLSKILAVTFTEKAALEMKKRLYEEIKKISENDKKNKHYHDILHQFDQAQITTIHGFCSQLLKENAVEAGVDPKFRVLEEVESDLLKESLLNQICNQKITENAQIAEDWMNFFENNDTEKIKKAVLIIYSQLQSLGLLTSTVEKPKSLPFENTFKLLQAKQNDYLNQIEGHEKKESVQKRQAAIKDALGWGKLFLEQNAGYADLENLDLPDRRKAGSDELKAVYDEFIDLWGDYKLMAYEKTKENDRIKFFELLKDFELNFSFEKRSQGLLDFDDLQVKTLNLLKSKKIKWGQYDFIMIDEMQDTSFIQFQIFNLLKSQKNIFYVGDHKQSIYGFRYAEPELFHELGQSKNIQRIELSENYRSNAAVLDFINEVFMQFWEKTHGYEPLAMGLKEKPAAHAPKLMVVTEQNGADVLKSTYQKKEALWVGHDILKKIEAGTAESEIVILFRSLNQAAHFEQVLKSLNIRYQLVQGKGFFDQLEIRDLLSFLRLLQNPTRELELFSLLRSPFFGVTDEMLYKIKKTAQKNNLLETVYQMLPEFKNIFKPLYLAQNKMTLSELLQKIISQTFYEAVSLGKFQGLRKVSNIRKLINAVAVFERNHGRDLNLLTVYLDHLQKNEMRETTLEPDEDIGSTGFVKLMTVHSAKGLEFNTVYVSAIDTVPKKNESPAFIFDGKNTLSIGDGYHAKWIKKALEQKELAEFKRIFYVACTRAKENLILTGIRKPGQELKETGANPLEWLMELYPEVKTKILEGMPGIYALNKFTLEIPDTSDLPKLNYKLPVPLTAQFENSPRTPTEILWPVPQKLLASQSLSATDYTLLTYCPRAFELKYILKVQSTGPAMEDDFEEILETSDEYLGRRVHDFIRRIEKTDTILKIKQRIESETLSFKAASDQKLFKKCLEVFLSSPYAVWISHKNILWREKKFMLGLSGTHGNKHLLQGIIDYAYLNNEDQWIVIDFKTSIIHSPAHRQWLRAHYFGQLQAYSLALEKLTGKPVKEAKLVFLSDHHCEEVFSRDELLLETLTGESLEKGFVDKPEKNLKHCEFCYLKGVCKP